MQITPSQAAQRLLDAIAAAMPYAPHRAEFDIVADAADDLRAALRRKEEAPTQETDMSTLREAAQQALAALEDLSDCYDGDDDYDGECASCHTRSYLPHDADCKRNNAVNALRAALKREEEALAWLEERKKHWRRELERMRAAPECPHGSDEACKLCYLEQQATPQQDPELSAALGHPGGISDPVLNRVELLRMVAEMRLAQPKEPQ